MLFFREFSVRKHERGILLRNGDFERLLTPAVYRFFFGKVADSVCEDLSQQTFEVVCRRRDAYRGDGSFRAYLFGCLVLWALWGVLAVGLLRG